MNLNTIRQNYVRAVQCTGLDLTDKEKVTLLQEMLSEGDMNLVSQDAKSRSLSILEWTNKTIANVRVTCV